MTYVQYTMYEDFVSHTLKATSSTLEESIQILWGISAWCVVTISYHSL